MVLILQQRPIRYYFEILIPLCCTTIHTGIVRNEHGLFLPWDKVCAFGQQVLLQSCSQLVDSNGYLTPAGDKAVGCINNGLAAGALAGKLGISPDVAKNILGRLASLTGCGGIVDMNKLPASQISQMLQQALSSTPTSPTSTAASSSSK